MTNASVTGRLKRLDRLNQIYVTIMTTKIREVTELSILYKIGKRSIQRDVKDLGFITYNKRVYTKTEYEELNKRINPSDAPTHAKKKISKAGLDVQQFEEQYKDLKIMGDFLEYFNVHRKVKVSMGDLINYHMKISSIDSDTEDEIDFKELFKDIGKESEPNEATSTTN